MLRWRGFGLQTGSFHTILSARSNRPKHSYKEAEMETLPGVIAEFSRGMVVHKDVRYFGSIRDELIELTIAHGQLNHVEVLIDGYNDDDRSLYEVPEVRRWVKLVCEGWDDALFWLTPGSLWLFVLSLNPEMHSKLPDGRRQITLDTDAIIQDVVTGYAAAEETLEKAGMEEDLVAECTAQAQQNLMEMFQRKQLGDYVVVHPKRGEVITYKSDS
jgi:hypothetical protein